MPTYEEYAKDIERIRKGSKSDAVKLVADAGVEALKGYVRSAAGLVGAKDFANQYIPEKKLSPIADLTKGMISDGLIDLGMGAVTRGASVPYSAYRAYRKINKVAPFLFNTPLGKEILRESFGSATKGAVALGGKLADGAELTDAAKIGAYNAGSEMATDIAGDMIKIKNPLLNNPAAKFVLIKTPLDVLGQLSQSEADEYVDAQAEERKQEEENPKKHEPKRMTRAQATKYKGPMDEFYYDPLL